MGIPYYFKSLIKKHPECLKSIKSKIPTTSSTKLYLDFNCAIHRNLSGDSDKERILNILKTLDDILSNFDSNPSTYLAIDGVVPVAKQIQQRFRRFTARSETHSNGSESWDRNQISPMTPFMQTLEKNIQRLYPWIIINPSSEPGEGEHKIMKQIKKDSGCEAYIYGLDADLIQLALGAVDNVKSINLLRENEQFGDQDAGYKLLDITFLKSILPIEYNSYLKYSTIFGNDFLPSLSTFGLRVKGYERFLNHIQKFPTTDSKNPMLDFYKTIIPVEEEYLKSIEELRRKSPPRFSSVSPVGSSIKNDGQNESITPSMFQLEQAIRFGEESWRERYYKILFGTSNEADIKIIAESYWKTLNWVLDYYSNNETTISWKWHYPWCDPPLIQDLVKYHSERLLPDIDRNIPSHISQLKFILPLRSWVPCGLTLPAIGEYESPVLIGYGGFLFKSFMWECHPILVGGATHYT